MSEISTAFIDFILHIDQHLLSITATHPTWTYAILFIIVFSETGLILTPFLPGDSLIFAIGAIIAKPGSELDIFAMLALLIAAALGGNFVNYIIGRQCRPSAENDRSFLLSKRQIIRAQEFYLKHGGMTLVYARFIPIIRTIAPFMAGVGNMPYGRFALYNVTGGLLWVTLFLFLGYFFGTMPFIEQNFTFVVFVILLMTALPPCFEMLRKTFRQEQVV